MVVQYARRIMITISLFLSICCKNVKAQLVLYECKTDCPFIEEILGEIKKIEPNDTTYWDTYYLNFSQFKEDISCEGGKLSRNDHFFLSEDPEMVGFFYWGKDIVTVKGSAALRYFEMCSSDSIVLPVTTLPTFAEYIREWPKYWIVNGKLQKRLDDSKVLKVLDGAIQYVLSTHSIPDGNYMIRESEEILDDSLSVLSQKSIESKSIANVFANHIKAYLRMMGMEERTNYEHCDFSIEVSNIQHGVFFIDCYNKEERCRYFFYIEDTDSHDFKSLLCRQGWPK